MPFNAKAAMRFLTSVRSCAQSIDDERERRGEGDADAMRITTRLMMGGECVMLNGHMVGGVCSDAKGGNIMLRVGKDRAPEALKMRGVIENTFFAGKPGWGGFVYVDVQALGLKDEKVSVDNLQALDEATMLAVELASALPEKDSGGRSTKKRVATNASTSSLRKKAKVTKTTATASGAEAKSRTRI